MLPGPGATAIGLSTRGQAQRLLSTTDGSVVRLFRGRCVPIRWWDQTRVLQSCGTHGDLVLLDPATGVKQRLAATRASGTYGLTDARAVGDEVYVEVAGGCGTLLGRRAEDGTVGRLRLPGFRGSTYLVDAAGAALVVEKVPACRQDDGPAQLTRFDPVTRTETPLLTLGRREFFGRILTFGETRVSSS